MTDPRIQLLERRRLVVCFSLFLLEKNRIHAFAQFLAGLEVRHLLARHQHFFPDLGLRPTRGERVESEKLPNPRISIR